MPMCRKSENRPGSARKYIDFRLHFVRWRTISPPTQAQEAFFSSLLSALHPGKAPSDATSASGWTITPSPATPAPGGRPAAKPISSARACSGLRGAIRSGPFWGGHRPPHRPALKRSLSARRSTVHSGASPPCPPLRWRSRLCPPFAARPLSARHLSACRSEYLRADTPMSPHAAPGEAGCGRQAAKASRRHHRGFPNADRALLFCRRVPPCAGARRGQSSCR